MRATLVDKHPTMEKNVTAQGKLLGQMWRELSDEAKEPFTKLATEDAAREQQELEGYREELTKARQTNSDVHTEKIILERKEAAEKALAAVKAAKEAKEIKEAKAKAIAAAGAKGKDSTKPPPKKRVRKDKPKAEKKEKKGKLQTQNKIYIMAHNERQSVILNLP